MPDCRARRCAGGSPRDELPARGTFNALIRDYRGDPPLYDGCPDWNRLRPRSKADYNSYLDRIVNLAGDRMVAAVTRKDLIRLAKEHGGNAGRGEPHARRHQHAVGIFCQAGLS